MSALTPQPASARVAAADAALGPAEATPIARARAHGMAYRPDIDGLRAVAVLAVVLYHAGLRVTSGGFVGVDVFFVISGYVISKSLLGDIDGGRFSISGFYERRVRRIFPALFATMIASWVAAMALLLPSYLVDYSRSLAAAAAFASNFYFWKSSGYFANGATLRPLLHTWSLSVEEQFYIFAPLTLFLVARYFRKRWVLVLAPVALASLALSIVATRIGPTANFFLLPTRAWELILGALLALGDPPSLKASWAREVLAALGLALIAYAIFAYSPATPFPGLAALPPCLGAAMLIYVGASGGSLATRFLALPPMVAVGLISYSLYLVHWPIVSFLTYWQLRAPGPDEAPAILAVSLALAALSWRFVEQPFRNRSLFHPSRRALLGAGLATMAFAAGLGLLGVATGGFPGRFAHYVDKPTEAPPGWNDPCFLGDNPDPSKWSAAACTLTPGPGPTALLWGDSYANHYAAGIKALAAHVPYRLIEYTAAGCPPVLSYSAVGRPGCALFNHKALRIVRDQHVKIVVLSARWVDLQRRGLGELTSTLDALKRLGVTTYVIGQSPIFTTDVHVIAFRRHAGANAAWPISFDPELNRRLAAMAGPGRFVDPLAHLCHGLECPYRVGGQFLFNDDGHFSVAGSLR
ncbi:MAG: acyltransferase family protein, partial [Caulobacteraceae bacterium]